MSRECSQRRASSDTQGVASFDWLPKGVGVTQFLINPTGGHSSADSLVYDPAGPTDLTARVRRRTRLSEGQFGSRMGGPQGRSMSGPAAGPRTDRHGAPGAARTGDDGRYALDVPPEYAYVVAVIDVGREKPHERGGPWSPSTNWARFHAHQGNAASGPDHRGTRSSALGGAMVMLIEKGEILPERFSRFGWHQGPTHAGDSEIQHPRPLSIPLRPRPIHGSRLRRTVAGKRRSDNRGKAGGGDRSRCAAKRDVA